MPDPARSRWLLGATLALVLAAASCGALPRGEPTRAPVHLGDLEVEVIADLLRLEDRRDYDATSLRSASAASHPEVRRRAALTLGRLRDPVGLSLLQHLLADPDTGVAASAAFALGQLGDTAAVAWLIPWVDAVPAVRSPTVASEAAAALGALQSAEAAARLRAFLDATPLPGGRDSAIEHALLAVWRHPRDGDLGPILRWTEAAHPELRWRAVYALVRRPDPAAASRLATMIDDADPRVRSLAARGLTGPLVDSAGLQRSHVLPLVLRAVDDLDPTTAVAAIRTLGTYPEQGVVGSLTPLLREEWFRAATAAETLGRLGGAAASSAPDLHAAALDPALPIGVRITAMAALVQVAPAAADTAARRLAHAPEWRLRAAAGRALATIDPRPHTQLVTLVRDPDPRVGAAALQALVDARGDEAAPLRGLLLESLGAADVQLRSAALTGLGRLADPSTLPHLLDALERAQRDTSNAAALAAVDALAAFGPRAAAMVVQRVPRPADYLVHQRAIARLGDPVRQAWGDVYPIDTGRTEAEYRAIVRHRVLPALAGESLPRAHVATASGTFVLRLLAADAPLTVENFLQLADAGYFDGQEWPRVVPGFVIQGGDPRGDQTGGPGYAIRDELNRHRYGRGTLGMALSGPDTGGSQFFVTHAPQPHLDGGYTVFGEVVQGMDVVDRVVVAERIESIRAVPAP